MTSLTATDLQGEYQGKLNGHLKSEDFWNRKYPTATLVIKKLNKIYIFYAVVADLTIKGITKPVRHDC
jgi:polyisoprenoid-binding protein YceI